MADYAVSLLTFESEPTVRGDLLGTAWPLNVEGVTAEVRLPRFNLDSPGTRDHWPTAPDIPDADRVSDWLEHDDGHVQWGDTYQHGPTDDLTDVVVGLKHALLVVSFPEALSDPDERHTLAVRAAAVAETWCKRMVEWLSLRRVINVDPAHTGVRIIGQPEFTGEMWLQQTPESQSGWNWLRPTEHVQTINVMMPPGGPNFMMFASTVRPHSRRVAETPPTRRGAWSRTSRLAGRTCTW